MESILAIGSGKSVDFMREAYQASASRLTKRTALHCLWQYSDEGRAAVREMRATAPDEERQLFEQINNESIVSRSAQSATQS